MKKVTAKNLMIGDWVKWRGYTRQVGELSKVNDKYKIWLKAWGVLVVDSATPIPITEEWLGLNGWVFRPFRDNTIYSNVPINNCYVSFWLNTNSLHINICKDDGDRWQKRVIIEGGIQYIHQLQQAYRLATNGKELKVKF